MAQVVAVAYSGGRDSTALLHATASAARGSGIVVVALHVHHGLLPEADGWVAHGRDTCKRWAAEGLPVRWAVHHVIGKPGAGDSIEEWARTERYAALERLAREAGASLVLMAHHRRDQAETVLLQALRGAGVQGLSAMPASFQAGGIEWSRPWLQLPRDTIDAYLKQHGLAAIEDPSNTNVRFDRNRLRRDVWPQLTAAFPNAEAALGTVAHWCQLAARVMNQVGLDDLSRCARDHALDLRPWAELGPDRANLALRAWLIRERHELPPSTLIERLCQELTSPGSGRWPVAGGELRRFRQRLTFHPAPAGGPEASTQLAPLQPEPCLSIQRAGRYRLPGWGGVLVATRVPQGGVPLAWLALLDLRARTGGEQFQAGIGRPPRSLKKQYQAGGVPDWDRGRGPLVYSGGQLVFVPLLGIDARVLALPGQPQLSLAWETAAEAGAVTPRKNAAGKR